MKEIINSFKSNYQYLKREWLLIVLLSLLGGIVGLVYSFVKKPVYTATTTFVLETGEAGANLGQYAGLASMIGLDLNTGGGIFQGNNILELYRSRNMVEKTLMTEALVDGKKMLLADRFSQFNELYEEWDEKPRTRGFRFTQNVKSLSFDQQRLQDSLLAELSGDINKDYLVVIKPEKNSIIRVDVNSKDEAFAKAFNDQIVANVNAFYVQTKTRKSTMNVNILQAKADSIRRVMNGAIFSAAAVADATPNLNPTKQLQRNAPIQRSQFTAETNKAILGELVKNLELSKLNLLKETPLIQVVDFPKYPLYKSFPGRIASFVIGTLLFGFLTVAFLLFKKLLQAAMA